jgi:hypothetical protein
VGSSTSSACRARASAPPRAWSGWRRYRGRCRAAPRVIAAAGGSRGSRGPWWAPVDAAHVVVFEVGAAEQVGASLGAPVGRPQPQRLALRRSADPRLRLYLKGAELIDTEATAVRPGPVGALPDGELPAEIRRDLATSPFTLRATDATEAGYAARAAVRVPARRPRLERGPVRRPADGPLRRRRPGSRSLLRRQTTGPSLPE